MRSASSMGRNDQVISDEGVNGCPLSSELKGGNDGPLVAELGHR